MRAEYADAVAMTRSVAAEHAEHSDHDARFPTDALAAMRHSRLLGLMLPAELGGGGGTLDDLVDVTIELGRVDTSVALIFAMHCQQVVALDRFAKERLRSHILPAVAEGKVYVASVTTELGKAGLLHSDTTTEEVRGGLRIERDAPLVTGGMHADGFLISMRSPGADSPTQVDLVYAGRDQLRIEAVGEWQPLGMRATESVPMRLCGTVPEWQLVGEHGDFRKVAASVFAPLAHVGWSAAWLGAAIGAYGRVVQSIRSPSGRKWFDSASEVLLTRLATARTRLDRTHAMLRHTVRTLAICEDPTATNVQLLVNALKIEAAESCFQVVDDLIELAGLRHGYLTGSPLLLERAFRDLRSASLNYGNDRLRLTNGSLALMDTGVRLA